MSGITTILRNSRAYTCPYKNSVLSRKWGIVSRPNLFKPEFPSRPRSTFPQHKSPSASFYLSPSPISIHPPSSLPRKDKNSQIANRTMQFSTFLPAVLLLGATPSLVHAANCNPGANNWGVNTAQYQQAASAICSGGTDVETFFGNVGGGTGRYVKSWFNGSKGSRSQCWVSPPTFQNNE